MSEDYWDVVHFVGNISKLLASGLFVLLSIEYLATKIRTNNVVRTIMRSQREMETKLIHKIKQADHIARQSLQVARQSIMVQQKQFLETQEYTEPLRGEPLQEMSCN